MPIGTALAVMAQHIPKKARRMLDIGWMLKSKRELMVTGIEMTPQAAEKAEIVLEAGDLPFDLGSFDCIVLADLIEHLIDPEKFLPQPIALLAPGGYLAMNVPNVRFPGDFLVRL